MEVIQSKGIYHALPTFPKELKELTAIITGANGISGYHMLKVLAQSPERWSKIYCLSRRPPTIPGGLPGNAEHIPCDFLKEPGEIAEVFKQHHVKADHVFFFSYIQPPPSKEGAGIWSDADELVRLNSALLKNFLGALEQAEIHPKRIMLQTGAKNYGVHLGPAKQPSTEWDARVELEPNFYYPQEDALWEYCDRLGIGWNVVMPAGILGAVPDAAMNLAYPLAVYAAVCVHLKQPLIYPMDMNSWSTHLMHSSAMMNGYLEEWAVLTDKAANQKFNAVDNSPFTFEHFWPLLAGWYGIEWSAPALKDQSQLQFVEAGYDPPPRGYGPKYKFGFLFTMVSWAKRAEVQKAWKEIAEANKLRSADLGDVDRIFGFLDSTLVSGPNLSMDKARKLGWHGFVDSSESLLEVFDNLAELKMIPPVPKAKVRFI